jgi:hypothetical protein
MRVGWSSLHNLFHFGRPRWRVRTNRTGKSKLVLLQFWSSTKFLQSASPLNYAMCLDRQRGRPRSFASHRYTKSGDSFLERCRMLCSSLCGKARQARPPHLCSPSFHSSRSLRGRISSCASEPLRLLQSCYLSYCTSAAPSYFPASCAQPPRSRLAQRRSGSWGRRLASTQVEKQDQRSFTLDRELPVFFAQETGYPVASSSAH